MRTHDVNINALHTDAHLMLRCSLLMAAAALLLEEVPYLRGLVESSGVAVGTAERGGGDQMKSMSQTL